jgi:hypothetical protein
MFYSSTRNIIAGYLSDFIFISHEKIKGRFGCLPGTTEGVLL